LGPPIEVLKPTGIEDEGEVYESIEDIWPDYPSGRTSWLIKMNISFLATSRKLAQIAAEGRS
jgi:hypothetical protein